MSLDPETTAMAALLEAPFSASGFPASIATRGTLSFTADDLAHALFTTGRAPGDQARHGTVSLWEFIHRATLVPAYLRRTRLRAIHKSALAQDLDRSEKVGLSYALGQAVTGIYCRQQLGVDFLMHVDRYAARFGTTFGSGRQRPDLFGMTLRGDWIVAEAKGRSNGMEASLPSKLATQKSMVKSVGGRPPKLALGCVASFPVLYSGTWDRLRVDVVDPSRAEEAVDLDVDPGRFLRAYYEPFVTAIASGEREADVPGYAASRYPGIGLRVGLLDSIRDLVVGDGEFTAERLTTVLSNASENLRSDSVAFPDGTIVETDWDDALANQDFEG